MSDPMPAVDLATLTAIARTHGLAAPATLPQPWIGATSRVYPCGAAVIKIAFNTPAAIEAVRIDACIAPFAANVGVAAPEVIAFDETLDVLPVPFSIMRRVLDSTTLDTVTVYGYAVGDAWRAVGRQIALVHQVREGAAVPLSLRDFRQTPEVDPRPWVDDLLARHALDAADARWLRALLDDLVPAALAAIPRTLCHGDINAANVLVHARTGRFQALIDWAGAGWLDPVWDCAGVPLDVVPLLLAGHREVAPLPLDETAEARICWCQIQTRLLSARAANEEVARRELARHIDQVRRFVSVAGLGSGEQILRHHRGGSTLPQTSARRVRTSSRDRHEAERTTMTTGIPMASGPASPEELRSRSVRFAVVGAGGMGATHARNLAGSREADVTWVVDLDLPRAESLVADIGGRATASLEEACAADDVDVVLVALPTGLHRLGVETAAKYRKHVFCEKPIARNSEDAEAMVRACEEAGVSLMVGHVVRFYAEYMRIKEILDAGTLGQIGMVRAARLVSPVMERSPWFADVEKSGGVVLDVMIHEIDTLRWFFGDVERVFAHGLSFTEWHTKRDYSMASLRFRNGVIAHLEASWAHSNFRTSIEISGQHGLLRHASEDSATVTLEPTTGIDYAKGVRPGRMYVRPTVEPPHLRELLRFIDCLRSGRPAPVDGREGIKTLNVANAVLDSMRAGRPVFFNEDGSVREA